MTCFVSNGHLLILTNTTVRVMAALTVITGAVNSLSTYWMEKMTKFYVIFHVCVLVSCAVALLALTQDKHDAEYVFTHVENSSRWTSIGFSWLFGFLSASWTMTDYDATAHIEELSDPERKAPGPSPSPCCSPISSPMKQPVAQIFYNSLGKGGRMFFTIAAITRMILSSYVSNADDVHN
ncbi:hypothetical protein NUU61_005976 [Penicillium alfredii]|uniref:Uncharacterized protein n=1 Tax=Penicillium alfredii TaxID=1506179 RepID=A0A9W9F049_9EURO|nr:uncharacterized protein NUU61_005976 [Penicillium alfredii]KAJ5091106.1 hypothetical protein NUU61_005976 [Penicillium alfredii]